MTITPTAPAPAVPGTLPGATSDGATTGASTGGPTVPGDFVALVQQALDAALGGTATPGGPAGKTAGKMGGKAVGPATTDPSADGAPGQGAGATADAALAAAANGLAGVVMPVPTAPVAKAVAVTGDPAGQVTPAGAAAAKTAGGAPLPAGPHAATAGQSPGQAPGQAAGDGDTASTPAVTTALPGAAHPGGAEAGASADAGQQPTPAAPTAPVVPTHTPTAATTGGPSAPAAAAAVTSQVFPEVTSLASRGDGTHRITLTLKPEALGEVRVVMTVRDGAVHVRLAAGHDAQQALLSGTSELSRLLEHVGATDTRIVVRDLGGSTAPTTGTSNDRGADLGQASGFSLGAGDNRSQDQHAGTRAEHHATDGGHDTTTAGTSSSRPVQPVTRTRTAGVDVTM